jgi:hypothetical protein
MESLSQLIRLLSNHKLRKLHLINQNERESKHHELFVAVQKNKISTDEEAAKLLGLSGDSYKISKIRFKEKVLNFLLLIDGNKAFQTIQSQNQYKTSKYLFISNTLSLFGAYSLAMEYANKAISICKKYQFYDLMADGLLVYLKLATRIGENKNWQEYQSLYKTAVKHKYNIEMVEFLYCHVLQISNTEKFIQADVDEILHYLNKIKRKTKVTPTIRTLELEFLSNAIYLQLTGSYKELQDKAELYISKIKNNTLLSKRQLFQALLYKLTSEFHRQNFSSGAITANEILSFMPKRNINYLQFLNIYFLFKMHQKKYGEALDIFLETKENPVYAQLPEIQQESWIIYEPYLFFALKYINYEGKNNTKINFNVLKFINSVPNFSKDKTYVNVLIRLAQILHHFIIDDFNMLYDKLDALKTYDKRCMSKYNKKQYMRSHYFIKAILSLANQSFNYNKMSKTDLLPIKQLKQTSFNMFNNNYIEVIPYEILWEMIVEKCLEKKDL